MADQFTYNQGFPGGGSGGSNSTYNNATSGTQYSGGGGAFFQGSPQNQGGGATTGGGNSGPTSPSITTTEYKTTITKVGAGVIGTIGKSDSPSSTLQFTFEKEIELPIPESGTRVVITPDVYIGTALKYITEYESGYISDSLDFTTESTWIKIERQDVGEQYKSVVSTINRGTYTNQDVKFDLSGGVIKMNITATKNDVAPAPDSPKLTARGNSYTWNINDTSPLVIDYTSTNSDYVEMSLGKITRQLPSSGVLTLSKTELQNIGNYTLYLQPVSSRAGSGNLQTISINVISKTYLPGPDITNITYPEIIRGKDFAGFNVDFDITWQSINTNYVDIYHDKFDTEHGLYRVAASGKHTLNVGTILRHATNNFDENQDKIRFKLLLVPYNTEGDEVTQGKIEEISILFDKGDLRLRRGNVVSDIREAFQRQFNTSLFKDEISKLLTHYIHFGDGDNKLISTWGVDTETFATYDEGFDSDGNAYKKKTNNPKSLVLKLYEPLPTSIQENQAVWISKVQSIPVIEQISIVGDVVNDCTLLTPNFNVNLGDDVGYQILDDLIASGSTTSTDLVSTYLSSSGFSLDNLDIQFVTASKILTGSEEFGQYYEDGDYTYDFSNFVKYSSAKERIENFVYKVGLLERYNSISSSLSSDNGSTSLSVVNERNRITTQISNVKQGFDSFEKWLYESSSEDGLTYPKTNNTGSLLNTTSSEAVSWYTGIINSAEEYDYNNKSSLINNLPQHIQDDSEGQDFVLFFNMIGQHFDVLWTHIKGVEQSKKLENKYQVGIKDDLVYHMLESLGWDADMGVKSQLLWEYAFGKHSDGTQVSSMSGKDRQQEIWRRLLNNLPYLNKHKGTKRALHAAMACYGIPASLLTVMEFGGPQDPQLNGTSKFTFEDRTAALNFKNSTNQLSVDWKPYDGIEYPNSVEFRINTTQKQNQVLAKTDGWKLEIESGSNYLGRINFYISGSGTVYTSSTDYVPVFYDDFYHIALNRTITGSSEIFDVYIKEGFNGRIRNSGSLQRTLTSGSTSWEDGSTLTIGGTQPYFTGSIDEFRLWTSPLRESRVENHTLIPDAIDGNHISASTVDLIFRNDFEYPKNRGTQLDVKNVSYIQSYQTSSVASGFESITDYPYNYTPYDRDVTATVPSTGFNFGNKFRFETQYDFDGNEITSNIGVELDYKSRATKKSYDTAPIDTDRLGLFFSPIKEINMDILKSLGNFNIDDYIGNPQDQYSDRYSELDTLRNYYFQRFDLNFSEYIQLVRYIDKSLFDTLESLVPARAKVSSGLLIEPHILERSKTKWSKPTGSLDVHETTINTEEDVNIQSTYETKLAFISASDDISFSVTNPQYEGTIVDTDVSTLSGEKTSYEGTYTTTDDSAQYGFITVNSGSDMGGISIRVDATFTGSLQGEYDATSYTQIGMDPDSITNKGFGLFASGSYTIQTYLDVFGNVVKRRVRVFDVVEEYEVDVPQNISSLDPSLGREFVTKTFQKHKVSILDWDASTPSGGKIVSATPLNGYFPSHYRNVGDLPTGLENSYFKGSKQTQATTLDGGSPVVTFTTNPNTLKVNDTGRGSGEPILIVE